MLRTNLMSVDGTKLLRGDSRRVLSRPLSHAAMHDTPQISTWKWDQALIRYQVPIATSTTLTIDT